MPPLHLTLLQSLTRLSTKVSNTNKLLDYYYTPYTSLALHNSCRLQVFRQRQRLGNARLSRSHKQSTRIRRRSLILTFQRTGPSKKPRSGRSPERNLPCFGTSVASTRVNAGSGEKGHDKEQGKSQDEVIGCKVCGFFIQLCIEELESKVPSLIAGDRKLGYVERSDEEESAAARYEAKGITEREPWAADDEDMVEVGEPQPLSEGEDEDD
ncbi:hypothetical protein Slin15195_G064350 [Septoria linicola]|uniref:Uncharacterized protein n=1 Tax=Septoria linicola TaxID=215465 RepID=A0A9Q9EIT7_9PEZI|nr:hypothetical protein Slin15195_G064350 [Septoria linicola]